MWARIKLAISFHPQSYLLYFTHLGTRVTISRTMRVLEVSDTRS